MNIKCKGCGCLIDRNTAYKVIHTTKSGVKQNFYYCSVSEYLKIQEETNIKEKIKQVVYEIFNSVVTHTEIIKGLKELYSIYDYRKVYNYLYDNKNKLSDILCAKTFNSEFHKIKYFIAVVKNGMTEYKEQKEEIKKEVLFEFHEIKYKPRPKRKTIKEWEIEYREGI